MINIAYDKAAVEDMLRENSELTEHALGGYLSANDNKIQVLLDAERYAVLGGGKRIRPTLVLEFCRLFGGSEKAATPFACAVEMVHSYSLVHDDLPCMDNDELRRGKPTCHRAYGEANALLAADALLTYAFEIAAQNKAVGSESAVDAVIALTKAAGSFGMVGGQIIDLLGEREPLDFEVLLRLHRLKTGALIRVSALLGCMAAGLDKDDIRTYAAISYAEKIGLAFQIVDDVLDVTGDETLLGKRCGKDAAHNKTTFMTYFSPDDAMKYAAELTKLAAGAIASYPGARRLTSLAFYLLGRDH